MYMLYIIYAQKVTRNNRSEFTRAFGNRSVYHEKRTETILHYRISCLRAIISAYPMMTIAIATPPLRAKRAARSMVGIPLAGILRWVSAAGILRRVSCGGFGTSGIIKREAQPPHLPHLVATRSQHTYTRTIQGVRTMDTLLNAHTVRKQPTGIQKT